MELALRVNTFALTIVLTTFICAYYWKIKTRGNKPDKLMWIKICIITFLVEAWRVVLEIFGNGNFLVAKVILIVALVEVIQISLYSCLQKMRKKRNKLN